MRKFFGAILVSLALCLAMPLSVQALEPRVEINSVAVVFADQTPVVVDGRTLVPVRGVFEALGFEVEWESWADINMVWLMNDEHLVKIIIGRDTFITHTLGMDADGYLWEVDKEHTLDVPPQLINDRTMLPIRLVLESVGMFVAWDGDRETVAVFDLGAADRDFIYSVNGDLVARELMEHFEREARNVLDSANVHNDPDFWERGQIGGINAGEYARRLARESVIAAFRTRQVARDRGLWLTSEDRQNIEETRRIIIEMHGSYEAFMRAMDERGVSDVLVVELTMLGRYEDNLFGDSMRNEWSEDCLRDYYLQEMFKIQHVLIQTSNEDGTPFTQAERDAARRRIDEIARRARAGEDFDSLVWEYSEDPGSRIFPEGYLMGRFNSGISMVDPFFRAARDLPMGRISGVIETQFGFHVLRKVPVVEEYFDNYMNQVQNMLWMDMRQGWADGADLVAI